MNMAAVWSLPVIFFCQNNAWAEGTAYDRYTRAAQLSDRAVGYGMPGVTVDGTDPQAVYDAVSAAAERARAGRARHSSGKGLPATGSLFRRRDGIRGPGGTGRKTVRPPFARYRARLIADGTATEAELDAIDNEVTAELDAAFTAAAASEPRPSTNSPEMCSPAMGQSLLNPARCMPSCQGDTEEMGLVQAINRTLDRAMAADDSIVLLGEDIGDPSGGGMFKVTAGLSGKYGEGRVLDTPIAESAIVGAAIGASLGGLRPVAELMFMDFLGVAMDQIANHAAKVRYMSGGRKGAPLVIRTMVGMAAGPQHSQAFEAWAMHTPGLKVVWPSTAADAAGLLKACLSDNDPCLFVESMKLYYGAARVPYRWPTT